MSAFLGIGLVCAVATLGCASRPDALERYSRLDPAQREAERAGLEEIINADHTRLANWVADPRNESDPELHDDPELRELVARLTESERMLAAYQEFEAE